MASKFLNLSTDGTLGGNSPSDELAVSQKAIKTYVDNHGGGSSGTQLPLFFQMVSDHILTGDEAVGWALQGSLITNTYSSAVDKIIELYNDASAVSTTYRNITCKLTTDGRYIADYSLKAQIDNLFDTTGIADFYILDSTNNRFMLPRTRWYQQYTLDTSLINQIVEDSASIYASNDNTKVVSSNKLLYYRVGNTIQNEDLIDVSEIAREQLDLQTKYANLITRVETLESLIAKAYLSSE